MACDMVYNRINPSPMPKTFLIPAQLEGTLRVVLAEKCGITPKEENGRQVFEFQKDGFLILHMDFLTLSKNDEYYLVDDKGNKTKVAQLSNVKNRVDTIPGIVVGDVAVTDMSGTTTNGNTVTTSITFQEFYLYNKETTEIKENRFSKKNDSLIKTAVYACRKNG